MKTFVSIILVLAAFLAVGWISCVTMTREDAAYQQKGPR